jgi:two-component sensor histidine kinase
LSNHGNQAHEWRLTIRFGALKVSLNRKILTGRIGTKLRIVYFFFFSFVLGVGANTVAQNPFIRHYTTLDGLPTNTIYQIYQDSHKFIWFTSDAGVVKFDGTNFTTYRKKDGLSSNDVVRIKEDSKGRLWLFNYNASVNYICNNKIYNGKNAPFLNSLMGKGFIIDFFTDSNQTINFYNWQRDVFVLDTNNKVSKHLLFKNTAFETPFFINNLYRLKVLNLSKNSFDEWVIWSNGAIFRQDVLQKRKIQSVDSSLHCRSVFPYGNNYYIITYSGELLKVTSDFQKKKIRFPGDVQKIKTIIEDSDGYLWIAANDEGVYCMKNNKVFRHFDIKDALGLLQDHEQNIWVSTQSNGIYIINHDFLDQVHYDRSYFENQRVNRLCDFPGTGIWCTNTKAAFVLKKDVFYKLTVPSDINPVNIIQQFKDKTLILGTISREQLCLFENITLNVESRQIKYSKREMHFISTKKIISDRLGQVIVLFDQNMILFTNSERQLLNPSINMIGERINNAYYNANNELVINAKKNYLYKKNHIEPYPELSRFDGSLIADHLLLDDSTELFNIDNDSLFILKNHRFYNLTDAFDIKFDKQIDKILYENFTLYLATLREIFVCRNPLKVLSGIPIHLEPMNISFDNISDILIKKDTLYIASNDGLTIIAAASIVKTISVPPIPFLQYITVNDKTFALPDHELKLTGKNNIHLSFGCISYSSGSIIYSYKLERVDNKWAFESGSGINMVYRDLPRGHYVFKLKVRKSNSGWSKPLELAITIKPTLFEHPAFWAVIVFIATGLIFLIISLIRIRKTKRIGVEHQLVVLEQKALQSMMNPHFIFNSLGSIQNYLLKNNGSEAVIYLSQFAKLIRQNLNAMNTPMIILEEEVDRLRNYIDLEKKRLENKFDYQIEIDARLEEDGVYIPSMIIQPIVENSIWHGIATLEESGVIKISIQPYKSKSLRISIEDNGIGIKKSDEYAAKNLQRQHYGMQMIKKRLDLLSKKYNTETSITYSEYSPEHKNPGTVVVLILPYLYTLEEF